MAFDLPGTEPGYPLLGSSKTWIGLQSIVSRNSFLSYLVLLGDPTSLYDFVVSKDITVLQGCGLGGTSLINANVALDADPRVFENPVWPKELRDDLKNLNGVDRKHFYDMIRPTPYPDSYPSLPKTEAMRRAAQGLGIVDVEDLGKIHKKVDL